jgi:hypothetical protein
MCRHLGPLIHSSSLRLDTRDTADAQELCECGFEAGVVRSICVSTGSFLRFYTLVSCRYKTCTRPRPVKSGAKLPHIYPIASELSKLPTWNFHLGNMRNFVYSCITALMATQALAGDDKWLSPVYKQIFQNPLPIPADKAPL